MAFDDSKKNKGPLLTSYNVGGSSVISGEWIAKAGTQQIDQEVPLSFAINGNGTTGPKSASPSVTPISILLEETLVQTRTDERKHTSLVLNPSPGTGGPPPGGGPPGSWTLVSEERIPNGQVATRTRSLVPEGSHLVLDDTMLTAEQRNLGVGALDQVVLTAPLPGPGIVDEKLNEVAAIATATKTRKLITQIVTGESIVTHTPSSPLSGGALDPTSLPIETYWVKVAREGETATVASEVRTVERLEQNAIITYRVEADGGLVTITKRRRQTSKILKGETVNTLHTLWTKTHAEGESGLVSTEVVEQRALPTPNVLSTRVEPDGTTTIVNRRKRSTVDIVTQEQVLPVYDHPPPNQHVIGYNWVKTSKEGESGLVATEVIETRFVSTDPTLNTLVSTTINQEQQVVVTSKRLKRTADIASSAALVNNGGVTVYTIEAKEVSDNMSQEISSQYPWTDKAIYSRSTEIGLPTQYRGLITTKSTENVVRGDGANKAAMPSALASGEIEKSEQQIDNLLKRKGSKVIDTASLVPTTVEELTTEYGGMLMDVITTVAPLGDTRLNIDPVELTQYNVISDKVTTYGTFGIREKKVNQSNTFPVLNGTEIDAELNIAIPYTQTVVAAGTAGVVQAGASAEVKPLDSARSLLTTKLFDLTRDGALDAFLMEYPGTTNVDLPPELVGVDVQAGNVSGSAAYHSEQGNFNILNEGQGRMDLTATASASVASTLEVIPRIKQVHGANVPCDNYIFFIGGTYPVVTYQDVIDKLARRTQLTFRRWPKFRPAAVNIVCFSKKQAVKVDKTMYRMAAFIADGLGVVQASNVAASDGIGVSYENEIVVKTVSIPPTIHGDITIATSDSNRQSWASANILMNGTNYNTGIIYANAAGTLSVGANGSGTIVHTDEQSTIPGGSQGYIHHMRLEPYKFGYFKCFVEIVYASDW